MTSNNKKVANPCTDKLTNLQYLVHMIPHHQVAIDMSHLLIPISKNPTIQHLCRDIIRKQEYEIWEMTMIKQNIPDSVFHNSKGILDNTNTKLDMYNPILSKPKEGGCNPLFFKPDDHAKHMEHMKVNDTSYLQHMIPHHQVAVDMSKRLLLHTNNSYLIDFCRKLIIDQQREIFLMNNLLNNKYNDTSELLN